MAPRKAAPTDLDRSHWIRAESNKNGSAKSFRNIITGQTISNRQFRENVSGKTKESGKTVEAYRLQNILKRPITPTSGKRTDSTDTPTRTPPPQLQPAEQSRTEKMPNWQFVPVDIPAEAQIAAANADSIPGLDAYIATLPPDRDYMILARGVIKEASGRSNDGPGSTGTRAVVEKTLTPRRPTWNARKENRLSQFTRITQLLIMIKDPL